MEKANGNNYRSRSPNLFANWLEVARVLGIGENVLWRLMKEFDIPRRSAGFSQHRYSTRDGRTVKSSYEQRVANWFVSMKIAYEYEPQLPFDKKKKADFRVVDKYVEIWGMRGIPSYDLQMKVKQRLYAQNGISVVEIFPEDMRCHVWKEKLSARFSPSS